MFEVAFLRDTVDQGFRVEDKRESTAKNKNACADVLFLPLVGSEVHADG